MIIAYWAIGEEHQALAEMSARSVERVYPEAEILITTRREPDRPMMVANIDAQIQVLQQADPNEAVLFLDTDTLLRLPFPVDSHDLTVTWRDTVAPGVEGVARLMPYNYGVIGCRARHATLEAFYWMRQRVLQMAPNFQAWYGNQLALAELCGSPIKSGVSVRHIKWSMTDTGSPLIVKYLPCDVYNYTPESEDEDITGKTVLHFKGQRKDMMRRYMA